MDNNLSTEPTKFLSRLGKCVFAWNIADRMVRNLLAALTRGSFHADDPKGDILVMELGSRQISEALQAFAHDVFSGEDADAVRYVSLYFDRLLPYRNYYIHGVTGLRHATEETGEHGIIETTTAKGRVAVDYDHLTCEQLDQFVTWAERLAEYTGVVLFKILPPSDTTLSWPERPPLPEQLAKRRLSLQELRRPH